MISPRPATSAATPVGVAGLLRERGYVRASERRSASKDKELRVYPLQDLGRSSSVGQLVAQHRQHGARGGGPRRVGSSLGVLPRKVRPKKVVRPLHERVDERLDELLAEAQEDAAQQRRMMLERLDALGIFDHRTNQMRADSMARAALRKSMSVEKLRSEASQQVLAGVERPLGRTAHSRSQLTSSQRLMLKLEHLDTRLAAKAEADKRAGGAPAATRRKPRRQPSGVRGACGTNGGGIGVGASGGGHSQQHHPAPSPALVPRMLRQSSSTPGIGLGRRRQVSLQM